jgi:hypothetical protein
LLCVLSQVQFQCMTLLSALHGQPTSQHLLASGLFLDAAWRLVPCLLCVPDIFAGAVPAHDIGFSLAWPAFLAVANAMRFSSNASHKGQPPTALFPAAWVKYYAGAAAVLALLLPAGVCIHAAFTGSSSSSSSTGLLAVENCVASSQVLCILGPHLYLTAMQVLCESLSSSSVTGNSTALLPRLLVPIGFNTYRMWVLVRWWPLRLVLGLDPGMWV